MSKNIQRVAKLETGLTPKQAILLWFQEAHGFNTIFEYIRHLKGQPDTAAPIPRLTDQVAEAVKQTLKGHPREEIDKAVRQAYKDVLFLFFLHQQVNRKLISEERYFWTQGRFLIAGVEIAAERTGSRPANAVEPDSGRDRDAVSPGLRDSGCGGSGQAALRYDLGIAGRRRRPGPMAVRELSGQKQY